MIYDKRQNNKAQGCARMSAVLCKISGVVVASLLLGTSALAVDMPALAKKHECDYCHAVDKRLVGPSLREISVRYKGATKFSYGGKEYPLETGLALKISRGGSGNWGAMPMPGSDAEGGNNAEIKELVRFILKLAP